MFNPTSWLRKSLAARLIFAVGLTLLLSISAWAWLNIRYQKQRMMEATMSAADRLVDTIRLGTNYAMLLNSRDDIHQIVRNVGRQETIDNVRIYNKSGEIKFSNSPDEVDQRTNIKDEACYICHRSDPPAQSLELQARIRIIENGDGNRRLGIITPIYNELSCATADCHVHPSDKRVLGALDLVVTLAQADEEVFLFERGTVGLAVFLFLVTSTIIFFVVVQFVNRPIKRLIAETKAIARGEFDTPVETREQEDELGQLAEAVHRMGRRIGENQAELEDKRDEYQRLFNMVPCLITVNDANYQLIAYNREFERTFDPKPREYCFSAYKGRSERCSLCPVELTFQDGLPHESEEQGVNKDGSPVYWLVKTSPVKDTDGNVVAAYEVSLDITERKILEEQLRQSEQNYQAIFNNIPNPVFVLEPDSLEILNCNRSVQAMYGWARHELIGHSFTKLFGHGPESDDPEMLKASSLMDHVRQYRKDGLPMYARVLLAESEYTGRRVTLAITSDVTKQLEAEQQLIQASKMATLGEMATGVAHELNQPLAVIKSASNFFVRKIDSGEAIAADILQTMCLEIDRHVDRATKIINHMREFGRKSDLSLVPVRIADVMEKAFEMFSQQLKVRNIEVRWDLDDPQPLIMGDPDRLEQVFINLLINARDAIEERQKRDGSDVPKCIVLRSASDGDTVVVEVSDTGAGIPEKMRDKLFEPFFTTKDVGKGTGLGLSISYGIVKDCGGTIEARPADGGGACFTMRFPAVGDEP